MRRGIVAANWKMNLRHTEVKRYLENFLLEVEDVSDAQIVFVPFYTSFPPLAISLESSQKPVELSAQYAQWERNRASQTRSPLRRCEHCNLRTLGLAKASAVVSGTDRRSRAASLKQVNKIKTTFRYDETV